MKHRFVTTNKKYFQNKTPGILTQNKHLLECIFNINQSKDQKSIKIPLFTTHENIDTIQNYGKNKCNLLH